LSIWYNLNDDKYLDEFSNDYNQKMENLMNGLYNALPEEYKKNSDSSLDIPLQIGINGFIISVSESGDFPTPTKS
jgi:hypothetical protein